MFRSTILLEANGYKTAREAYLVYYWPEEGALHKGLKLNVKAIRVKTKPGRIPPLLRKAKKALEGPTPARSKECIFCAWQHCVFIR